MPNSKILSFARSMLEEAPLSFRKSASLLVLIWMIGFTFLAVYYREPLGDDVLYQTVHGYRAYLDGNTQTFGPLISDSSLIPENLEGIYTHNGGRMVGFALIPLLTLVGPNFTALCTSIFFALVVWMILGMALQKMSEPWLYPPVLLATFAVVFYLAGSIDMLLMWTMTSIYVVSVLLLSTYYWIFSRTILGRELYLTSRKIFLFNLLGFLAGFTHEVFAFSILSFVLFISFREYRKNRGSWVPYLRVHCGLILGVLSCVLAKGNFVRLANSHDAKRAVIPYARKLLNVVLTDIQVLIGFHGYSIILLVIALALFLGGLLMRNRSESGTILIQAIRANARDFGFLAYLTLVWAFFPYIGSWGTLLFVFWSAQLILSIFFHDRNPQWNWFNVVMRSKLGVGIAILGVFLLVLQDYRWMPTMISTSIARQQAMTQAHVEGKMIALVPEYPQSCSNRFTMHNYNNLLADKPDAEYYVKYFGVVRQVVKTP